jgi:hypothetical protein
VAPVNASPRIQPQGRQPGCFVVPTPRDVAIPKSVDTKGGQVFIFGLCGNPGTPYCPDLNRRRYAGHRDAFAGY